MNKQLIRYLQLLLLLLDVGVFNLAVFSCKQWFVPQIPPEFAMNYFHFLVFTNMGWLLLSWAGALYSEGTISSFEVYSKRSMHVFLVWLCVSMLFLFFSRQFNLSRFFLITCLSFFSVGLLINRFVYVGIRNFYRDNIHLSKRVIILGYNSVAKKLVSYLEKQSVNTRVIGYLDEIEQISELSHYPIISSIDHAMSVSREHDVTEIISTITPEQNSRVFHLMHEAESACIRFKIIPDISYFISRQMHIEYIDDMPIISMRSEPLEDVGNRAKKRFLDILVSLFVITFILSWLMPLISLLIKIESRGPVLFKQLRSGKNNKSFVCLKFRSMKVNKEADSKQAVKNDDRLTWTGKILRKTSLDELPQFFNVLRGEMSLVGPRPHMLRHTQDYSKLVDHYMIRQFLKPGITGWAQVNGYRGEINGNEQIEGRVARDIWYSENWSLWLDIRILFLTVYKVVLGDKRAY